MKTLVISILSFFCSCSLLYSQSNWYNQVSGITNHLNSIFFIDANTGWAAGYDGVIIKTINGGSSWFLQNSNTIINLNEIAFANANTGWAVGGGYSNHPFCEDTVVIAKTTNGGANWIVTRSGYGYTFNDLSVMDENTASVSFHGFFGIPHCFECTGNIQITSNSGASWNNSLPGDGFYSVDFLNPMTGWAAEAFSTDTPIAIFKIRKTTDGGLTWATVNADTILSFPYNYKKIRFLNDATGYLIKFNLRKSTDGGITWASIDSALTANINSYYFVNPDTGWCVAHAGKIIRTDNGGSNWTSQTNNTTTGLTSVYFANSLTGWAAGYNGTILKTVTGGLTSISATMNDIPTGYSLEQNFPNPFNPETIINYSLGKSNFVKLKIYDINGKEIKIVVNGTQPAGNYTVKWNAGDFSSGIYFYTIEIDIYKETKRMVLLR